MIVDLESDGGGAQRPEVEGGEVANDYSAGGQPTPEALSTPVDSSRSQPTLPPAPPPLPRCPEFPLAVVMLKRHTINEDQAFPTQRRN